MNGAPEWSQIIFISGVIMTSVTVGAGFALWIMGRLGSLKDETAAIKLELMSQSGAMEKVIGALRIALTEEMRNTRHTIYGRIDMMKAAGDDRHDELEARVRVNEVDISGLKAAKQNGVARG